MDISAYVFDISIYGCIGQFVINASSAGPPGPAGPAGADGSINDASINEIYSYINIADASLDASINDLYATKQDNIADGTYLKEASIGDGLSWNAGLLDVSVDIPSADVTKAYVDASLALRDASISYLYDYTLDLSTRIDNFSPDQDASITDLYNIKENKTDVDSSLADVYTYVDGSLALRDASISYLYDNAVRGISTTGPGTDILALDQDVDNRLLIFYSTLSEGNNISFDVSIDAYSRVTDIEINATQDASVENLYDTKQDIIPDGTYLKEASLGDGLSWNAGLLDVSVDIPSVDVTKAYVDGSLGARDTSIAWLNTNKVNKALFDSSISSLTNKDISQDASIVLRIKEASLGTDFFWNAGLLDVSTIDVSVFVGPQGPAGVLNEASVNEIYSYIDTSLAPYATNASVGLALGAYATNASVGLALAPYATNASIGLAGFAKQTYVDASLALRDASIAWLNTNKLEADDLYSYATNASIGLAGFAKQTYVDGSLNAKQDIIPDGTYLKEASLGDGLSWNAGLLDVSVGAMSSTYKTANYQVATGDFNNLIEASGTLTIYLPNTMATGYSTNIVAVGGATPAITISASTGTLYTTDSSVVLRDRYAAATAYHKGSGIWYAWGNLK